MNSMRIELKLVAMGHPGHRAAVRESHKPQGGSGGVEVAVHCANRRAGCGKAAEYRAVKSLKERRKLMWEEHAEEQAYLLLNKATLERLLVVAQETKKYIGRERSTVDEDVPRGAGRTLYRSVNCCFKRVHHTPCHLHYTHI